MAQSDVGQYVAKAAITTSRSRMKSTFTLLQRTFLRLGYVT
jgi:hypothetical protein